MLSKHWIGIFFGENILRLILTIICFFLLCTGVCFSQDTSARYVSLAPSSTEILFAIGLDKEIVGVSSYCNYPQQARLKEIVGTFSQPNIEKIVSLKPDIVFCAGIEQAPVAAQLKRLGIKVAVHEPKNIKELLDSIKEIGGLTAKQAQAEELVKKMQQTIQEVNAKAAAIPLEQRPWVFVEYWNNPLMTAGPGSFIDELITLAGGRNIAYDAPRAYCNFSPEEVLSRNPGCIILAYMVSGDAATTLTHRLGWSALSAVKNKRVYSDINPDLLLRPGPRIVEGLRQVHIRLYPQDKP